MSEPKDCRCPNCHCPTGTRNPDGLCRRCANGECLGERKQVVWEPEWIHRAHEHHLPAKVVDR